MKSLKSALPLVLCQFVAILSCATQERGESIEGEAVEMAAGVERCPEPEHLWGRRDSIPARSGNRTQYRTRAESILEALGYEISDLSTPRRPMNSPEWILTCWKHEVHNEVSRYSAYFVELDTHKVSQRGRIVFEGYVNSAVVDEEHRPIPTADKTAWAEADSLLKKLLELQQ